MRSAPSLGIWESRLSDPDFSAAGDDIGRLVSAENGILRGWAKPEGSVPAIVQLVAGGRVLAEAIANEPGLDGEQTCFTLVLPEGAGSEAPIAASIRVRHGGVVSGSEITLQPGDFCHAEPGFAVWPPLPWRFGPDGVEGFIDSFGPIGIHGWAQSLLDRADTVNVDLFEDGIAAGSFSADCWRNDLQETRQGDGRWGIDAALPDALRDGRLHLLQARFTDGTPALAHKVMLRVPVSDSRRFTPHVVDRDDPRPSRRPPPRAAGEDIVFSFIVVFYNMTREAKRTLHSLSRVYQNDIGALRYEVMAVDNGSDPPLDEAVVTGFGPEFRLIRPDVPHPSPCQAINEAARQARGRHVAIMIDGAHVLSPGVLREAWDAVTETPDAVIGLRPWFVGGDQRWLASAGYTRAQEDIVFQRIGWPRDGYRLFEVSSPYWESPNTWFDAMIESNCLFVPATVFNAIGGMDDAFDEPGAGFANLDLFRRAADAGAAVIVLIGEATFHQFHETGMTTNIAVAEKESRVRAYENRYVALRGKMFRSTLTIDLRVRGQFKTKHAMIARQRPLSQVGVGVTDRIRPGSLPHHFDEPAQEYLQSTYVECGLHEEPRWLGEKIGVAPADAMQLAELTNRLRADRIVAVNAQPGLVAMLDTVLALSNIPMARIIASAPAARPSHSPRVVAVQGRAAEQQTQRRIETALAGGETVLVILSPDPGDDFPVETLLAYARFVTLRSYFVILGTAFGQPWLGYSTRWYRKAIQLLLQDGHFAVDHGCTTQLISISPGGYLQRIGPDLAGQA